MGIYNNNILESLYRKLSYKKIIKNEMEEISGYKWKEMRRKTYNTHYVGLPAVFCVKDFFMLENWFFFCRCCFSEYCKSFLILL